MGNANQLKWKFTENSRMEMNVDGGESDNDLK